MTKTLAQKQKKTPKRSLLILLIILGITLAVVGGLIVRNNILVYLDARRFAKIEIAESSIIEKVIERISDKVSKIESQKICFNTEQGPYDNGKLWCQTATIVQLKEDVDFLDVGEWFVDSARDRGYASHSAVSYGVPSFWFEAQGASCDFGYVGSGGEERSAGASNVLYRIDPPAFAVACADRAKAKHYLYVD